MPRSPRSRSARSETVRTLDACKIMSRDAVLANLSVQHLACSRLDAIEYSARYQSNFVHAELQALKSKFAQLESFLRLNAVDGQSKQVVISGAPLVVRDGAP